MIELQDGILLYHGSYVGIPKIDLQRCFGGLDFGRGFYLTSSYEQAYHTFSFPSKKPSASAAFLNISIRKMGKYLFTDPITTRICLPTVSRVLPLNGSIL